MTRARRKSSTRAASDRGDRSTKDSSRGHGAYGALIKAGAAAAAVASIAGVILTFVNLWPDDRPPPNPTVELVKPQISELMTYEVYAKLRRWKTDTLPPEERGIKGVEVEYKATVKGAPAGTTFPIRLTLLKVGSGTTAPIPFDGERLKTEQLKEDSFVQYSWVPSAGPGVYKLRVEAPHPSGSSSFASVVSDPFRFVGGAAQPGTKVARTQG